MVDLSFDYQTREESIVVKKSIYIMQIEKRPQESFEQTME
jgi:hypothetical protein